MAKYVNITSGTTTTLIAKENKRTGFGVTGSIKKITISNNNSNTATGVGVNLCSTCDGSDNFYFIRDVKIPPGTTLVLEDNLSFDKSRYNLKIAHDSGSGNPNLTVIIK